jgi:hypothetical protein
MKAYVGAYYDINNNGDADIYEIDISSFKFWLIYLFNSKESG